VLRSRLSRAAVSDFPFGEDSIQKEVCMTINHLSDAETFDDVRANSNDLHGAPYFKS
jgi:hypothetical protein